jgi:KDO2-lipid IV(A) lauroyltransferase
VAQSGSALAWGASGRWFKSSRPDHFSFYVIWSFSHSEATREQWMIGLFFYKLGSFLARHLPENVALWITEALVDMQYAFRVRSRRVVAHNLGVIAAGSERSAAIAGVRKSVFSHFGRSIYYFLRAPAYTKEELLRRTEFEGLDTLCERLVAERGVILVGPHVGSWEVGGAALSARGIDIVTVAMPHGSPHVTRFFETRRKGMGIRSLPLGASLKGLRRALNGRGVVALLVDRAYAGRRARLAWFGRPDVLPTGHAALAVSCKVPVLTTVCLMKPDGRFRFIHRGPYYADSSRSDGEAAEELAMRCVRDMEDYIRSYPEQWFHFYRLGDPLT